MKTMKTMICTLALSVCLITYSHAKEAGTDLLTDYITLKDSFVKSDVSSVKIAASILAKSLKEGEVDATALEAANLIASSDDLAAQRVAFKTITDQMIKVVKAIGTDQSVFVQYCPMAFNNTGANWLSFSEEIRNPYFGDMMLKCGSVKEKL